MSEAVILQDPAETVDYALDWTAWLAGDTILTSNWAVSPTGPALSSPSRTSTSTVTFVAGVVFGKVYALENTVTTTAGRTGRRGVTIRGFIE